MNYGVFSGAFWGFLLILAGILVVLKNILHLQIPVFKLILGVFFIYLGITMLVGGFAKSSDKDIVFSSGGLTPNSESSEHNVIFGTGTIDFSALEPADTVREYEINVIFSSAELILNPNIPVQVKTSAVFASAKLPDNKSVYFGNEDYATPEEKTGSPVIIDANVVFGSLEVKNGIKMEIVIPDTISDSAKAAESGY
mgnify:CR=1 FL=1